MSWKKQVLLLWIPCNSKDMEMPWLEKNQVADTAVECWQALD
jgi:hypothetical protein